MNVFSIGTTDYALKVIESSENGLSYLYELSYLDSFGKIHAITFSHLNDYADFICMLIEKNGPYV